jgi:hypothetical protein
MRSAVYSEFIPLEAPMGTEALIRGALGDNVNEILDGVESLFD